jgi:hypothetical protein
MEIITERVYNTAFPTMDKVVKIDVFPITNEEIITLIFEEKNSEWKQGVWIGCDNGIEINGQHMSNATLWYETAPNQVFIKCFALNGLLMVYNVWDRGMGRNSQSHSSGMLIEDLPLGRRYKCNDIGFETNFNKLVFRIEHILK